MADSLQRHPRIKQYLFRIVLAVAAVLVTLVAAEFLLRWSGRERRGHGAGGNERSLIYRRSEDPELVYELKPGGRTVVDGIEYANNSDGFRDDEFPEKIDEGAPRIVLIGDSVSLGVYVPMHKAFPQILERSLRTGGAPEAVVLNMAVTGYSTAQEIRLLETRGYSYQPDLVILVYVMNDPDVFDGGLSRYFTRPGSELLRLIESVIDRPEIVADNYSDSQETGKDYYQYIHARYTRQTEEQFERLGRIQGEKGVPILVVFCPAINFEAGKPYLWDSIRRRIVHLAEINGLPCLDLYEALAKYSSDKISPDRLHLSEKGHEVVAEELLQFLLERAEDLALAASNLRSE